MSSITKTQRIETLQKALGEFLLGDELFTCYVVWYCSPRGVADRMVNWYRRVLARHSGLDPAKDKSIMVAAFNPKCLDNRAPAIQEHRMMWLAWLIMLLEEGAEP
jgi:hypothetical protein